jgi:uncharacterized protein YfbU (UPF0304 family)
LAEKHGLTRQTVVDASSEGQWVAKRNAFRTQVKQGSIDLCAKRDTKILDMIAANSVKLMQLLDAALADEYAFRRYIAVETERDGDRQTSQQVERIFERVDLQAIKQLADTQKTILDTTYKLYNIPTQAEKESQRIASERLKMDKARAEAETKSENEGIVVRMELPEGVDA